jgi:hypothetical protein
MSNAAARVRYIPFVAWDYMDVEMVDRLSSRPPRVEPDVVTVRLVEALNGGFDVVYCAARPGETG